MRRSALAVPATLFIAAWFLWFAGSGLAAPFSGDDLMNLHQQMWRSIPSTLASTFTYWTSAYRPMGCITPFSLDRLV